MQYIWSKFRTPLGWVAVVTVLVFPIFKLSGAANMFLKLNGIDGESTDAKYGKQIEVLAWSWGASNSGTTHTGGGGAGTTSVQDIAVTKNIDKTTPALILRTMNGKQIADGVLTVRSFTVKGGEYEALKIELKNILVTSVSTGGSAGQTTLTENISLNFGSFQLTYIPLVNDVPGTGIPMRWNIAAGTESF
jgi:type VI secretion system secreted protein Hcp